MVRVLLLLLLLQSAARRMGKSGSLSSCGLMMMIHGNIESLKLFEFGLVPSLSWGGGGGGGGGGWWPTYRRVRGVLPSCGFFPLVRGSAYGSMSDLSAVRGVLPSCGSARPFVGLSGPAAALLLLLLLLPTFAGGACARARGDESALFHSSGRWITRFVDR